MNANELNQNTSGESNSLPITSDLNQQGPTGGCCGVGACPIHKAMWGLTAAIVFFGTAAFCYLVWFTNHPQTTSSANWSLPSVIDASAAVTSEKYSVATGFVGEAEGFFVLDHNSGLLQCSVMYPRLQKFNALFSVNVNDALGSGSKGGAFLMLTGQADFQNSSTRPIASTLVYVLNTATGNYAAYAIPFDRTALNAGRPQQAPMVLMGTGQANPLIDRNAIP